MRIYPPNEDGWWMDVAIAAAVRSRPWPNPQVGAAIVRDGVLVSIGWHVAAGQAHAEVDAIAKARGRTAGATLYTTLEPCNHHGRTPPCVDAIAGAGIERAVIGMLDPNPHVTGGGAAALSALGVRVVMGVRESDCRRVLREWLASIKRAAC